MKSLKSFIFLKRGIEGVNLSEKCDVGMFIIKTWQTHINDVNIGRREI